MSNRMVELKDPTPEKTAAIIGRPNIYTKVGFFVGKDEFKYAFVSTNSVMIEEEPKIAQKIRHITAPEMQPGGEIVIANIVARDKWTINTIGIGGYEHLTFSMPVHAGPRRYNLGALRGRPDGRLQIVQLTDLTAEKAALLVDTLRFCCELEILEGEHRGKRGIVSTVFVMKEKEPKPSPLADPSVRARTPFSSSARNLEKMGNTKVRRRVLPAGDPARPGSALAAEALKRVRVLGQ